MSNSQSNIPVISPAIQAKIGETQRQQQQDDKAGMEAVTASLPGPLKDVWTIEPDIMVGPYKVRRFTDGDFIRLAAFDHKLRSLTAIDEWMKEFEPSGKDAWLICWMMTRSTKDVREAIKSGKEIVLQQAEEIFSELSAAQIASVLRAIVAQLFVFNGVRMEFKPATEDKGDESPPPSSQP